MPWDQDLNSSTHVLQSSTLNVELYYSTVLFRYTYNYTEIYCTIVYNTVWIHYSTCIVLHSVIYCTIMYNTVL